MIEETNLRERMQRIADLVRRLDGLSDSGVRLQVRELLQSVLDLHGEAFGRVLERLNGAGQAGNALIDELANDPVVLSVLVLHGLHPLDFDTRVHMAMERAQAALRAQGAVAELTGTKAGEVRIRIRGVDDAQTARAVRSLLEDELYAIAPDAVSVVLLGLEKFASPDFVPLEQVGTLAGKASL